MQSELAERLLDALTSPPDVAVCPQCAGRRLEVDRWDIVKAIKELIAARSVLCLLAVCTDCGRREMVTRVRVARW